MSIVRRVGRFAARHGLWRPETRVVAALSGGSDSVALLRLLHALHQAGQVSLAGAAHLHHGLRGADADEDEQFCRHLTERLAVPLVAARVDVPTLARSRRQSIEVAAREARRTFLGEARVTLAADRVATAHTQDDQAETVLMRVLRGTGMHGLGGIAPAARHRIRPLLECTRDELRDYLRAVDQPWRDDATNANLVHPRNRLRHEVIPYLARHFNPSIRQAVARLATMARADDGWLHRVAAAAALPLIVVDDCGARLDAARLNRLPPALARRVIQQAIESVLERTPDFLDVEQVRAVVAGDMPAATISRLSVEHSGAAVVLVPIGVTVPIQPFRMALPVPGQVTLPEAGWTLEAEGPIHGPRDVLATGPPDQVEVDAAELGTDLIVRTRQPGDRLRPLGLGGHKKLQDVFVDRKVDRRERDRVPVVTDARGRIVWVAGHVLSEEFGVTERTNAVVVLKLRRVARLAP